MTGLTELFTARKQDELALESGIETRGGGLTQGSTPRRRRV